jgi:hypothetical protein
MRRYAYPLAVLLFASLSHARAPAKPDCPEGKCPAPKAANYAGPKAAGCEQKAVSKKSGKKLSGAAKNKFMEKCMNSPE